MMSLKHAAFQFGTALIVFTLWAAADSWYLLTDLGLASALSVVLALITGFALTTVVHEWSHFLGAVASGSVYRIPENLGLFVYDFDFQENSLRQFNIMSLAGQAGSFVTIAGLWWLIPMDNPGRVMLVSAAIGSTVFAAMIEWPVLRRSQQSSDPLAELGKIGSTVLRRSALGSAGSILLAWLIIT